MIIIELNYNNAYKWMSKNDIYVIGYIFYKNKVYKNEELLEFVSAIDEDKLENTIKEVDGCFSIVYKKKQKIILISDLLRTFPVFYSINNSDIIIKDNIMAFEKKELDYGAEIELTSSCYVTKDRTIFLNIKQLEGHQIVFINTKTFDVEKKRYFEFKYNFDNNSTDEEFFKEFDRLWNIVAKRVIMYLNGRRAVIPLSGGQDSRLLAYYLKKNNYDNIVSYTYGSLNNSEIEKKKKVAEFLNIEWHFIEYRNESMQKKFYDKNLYSKMADYCGRGFSVPIIQEWEAITKLLEEKIIDKECVMIPGFTGDFLSGSHLYDDIYLKQNLTFEDLTNVIWKYHYSYANITKERFEKINGNIINDFECKTREDLINRLEKFDFQERQAKYITNYSRTYDYQGLEWVLPFWSKEIIYKWLTVPLEKRYKRKLCNEFANYIYGDLMEYAPIYNKKSGPRIKPPFIVAKLIYKIYDRYKNGFLNFYGYFYFRTYIKYLLFTRKVDYNKMFAIHYIKYLKRVEKENIQ